MCSHLWSATYMLQTYWIDVCTTMISYLLYRPTGLMCSHLWSATYMLQTYWIDEFTPVIIYPHVTDLQDRCVHNYDQLPTLQTYRIDVFTSVISYLHITDLQNRCVHNYDQLPTLQTYRIDVFTPVISYLHVTDLQDRWVHTCDQLPTCSRPTGLMYLHLWSATYMLQTYRINVFTSVISFLHVTDLQDWCVLTCDQLPTCYRPTGLMYSHLWSATYMLQTYRLDVFTPVINYPHVTDLQDWCVYICDQLPTCYRPTGLMYSHLWSATYMLQIYRINVFTPVISYLHVTDLLDRCVHNYDQLPTLQTYRIDVFTPVISYLHVTDLLDRCVHTCDQLPTCYRPTGSMYSHLWLAAYMLQTHRIDRHQLLRHLNNKIKCV